jgi:hypothetical protein
MTLALGDVSGDLTQAWMVAQELMLFCSPPTTQP